MQNKDMYLNLRRQFLLLLHVIFCSFTYAFDFKVDGIYYNIISNDGKEVSVTRNTNIYEGSITIPSSVIFNDTQYTITAISEYTFGSALTSISLPSTLQTIENFAFEFSGLTDINIPNGVKRIGSYAFLGSSNLRRVHLPSSLTTLESGAFMSCPNIEEVHSNITIPFSIVPDVLETFHQLLFYMFPKEQKLNIFRQQDGLHISRIY